MIHQKKTKFSFELLTQERQSSKMAKSFNGLLLKSIDNLLTKHSSVRLISYNQRRDISNTKPNVKPEEMKRLNWFYNHHLIDISAAKPMVKIHPSNLLFIQKAQDARHLIVSLIKFIRLFGKRDLRLKN